MSMVSFSLMLFSLITILLFSWCSICEARDSISVGNPLESGETLVSAGSIFELGFFTPEGNIEGSKYLGIWYTKLVTRTIVWVASRDAPMPKICGSLRIANDGNVQVVCGDGRIFPVISLEEKSENFNGTLQLLDSGNLVLVDGKSTRLWQSFDYPTDTFLPGMKMSDSFVLTSWISQGYPGKGKFTFRQADGVYVMNNRSAVYWKSDEPAAADATFMKQNLLPNFVSQMLSSSSQVNQTQKSLRPQARKFIPFPNNTKAYNFNSSRLLIHYSGKIQFFSLVDSGIWELLWSAPEGNCSVYNRCGSFGICSENEKSLCQCPSGYKQASLDDWKAGIYSGGCVRETSKCDENMMFNNLLLMSVGGQIAQYDQARAEEECKKECLNECSCVAYAFKNVTTGKAVTSGPKCFTWTADLVFHGDGTSGGLNLSIRVPLLSTPGIADEPKPKIDPRQNKLQKTYVIAIAGLVAGIILLSFSACILYRRRRIAERPGYKRNTEVGPVFFSNESERHVNNLMQENEKRIDVPFYDLESILSSTDNFSDANKLGQGGFGPVYKGRFPGGREIAVKRLSSCSGQGIEEFLNEVILIAKLQHRNLVRLLGYCIKGSEKILLYEYMSNRSLDAFIFDQHNRLLLDWKKRFDIILGIARGLLYLHQDSRLRIIHRDLKTSNILLDEDMNPKISDFGLARIVEGEGTEASTNKVVGTYGYMSPEYALDGKFSIKSDVFSFGVVILEIISGRKNSGFYNPKEVLNLLGYAWRLWCDNNALDIIDPTLLESFEKSEVVKCINIGLLCVQEDPNDRPPMSTVVMMLGCETTPLPPPTQPAFVVRRRLSTTSSSSSAQPDSISLNELTFSMPEGR